MRENLEVKGKALAVYVSFAAEIESAVDDCLRRIETSRNNLGSSIDALRKSNEVAQQSPRENVVDRTVAAISQTQ